MHFRYRTAALAGNWRCLPEEAIQDAVAAGQALRLEDGTVRWRVLGAIEAAPAPSQEASNKAA